MLIAEGAGERHWSPTVSKRSECVGVEFVGELICNYEDVIFLFGGVLFPLLLCSHEIVPLVGSSETGEQSFLRG